MSRESDLIIENIIHSINERRGWRGHHFDDYTTGADGFVWDNNANGDEEARRHMWYQAWHDPEERYREEEDHKAAIAAKRAATVKARQEAEQSAFLDEEEIPEIIADFVSKCVELAGTEINIDPKTNNRIKPAVINQ